jgi:hypothetical protein
LSWFSWLGCWKTEKAVFEDEFYPIARQKVAVKPVLLFFYKTRCEVKILGKYYSIYQVKF